MNLTTIKDLAAIKPDKNIAVSMYLNIDAKERRHSDIKTILNHLIRDEIKNMNISDHRQKHFRADLEQIRYFFESEQFQQGKNRGVAIFSKSTSDIFDVVYFPQPVQDRILFSQNFLVRPLLGYLDLFTKYLALFVDQTRGKFFEVDYGEISDFYNFKEQEPRKVKAGGYYGYAERHIERHIDDHLHQHYKKVSEKAFDMIRKYDFQWLILVGLAENLYEFKKTMHPYLKDKLAGELRVNIAQENTDIIMDRLLKEIDKIRSRQHQNIESEIKENFPAKGKFGIEDVEYELDRKSVQKLLLSPNVRPVMPVCGRCDYMLHDQLICPNCKIDLSEYDQQTNEMVIKALAQNSEIHFYKDDFLDQHMGVGAILRYQ
ncbi:MAG TPA: hypothetical protein ENH57_03745 [Actinobacteria bacterium]|nr:hypothetical protein [Actinomycetota bacterium]